MFMCYRDRRKFRALTWAQDCPVSDSVDKIALAVYAVKLSGAQADTSCMERVEKRGICQIYVVVDVS